MAGKSAQQLVSEAKSQIENLSPDQVQSELAAGNSVLIDLREAAELANGHIAGAVHVPRGMLEFHADPTCPAYKPELKPAQRTLLYCASSGRSALAVQTLKQMGYSNVAHLDGGFKAWLAAGKPVAYD